MFNFQEVAWWTWIEQKKDNKEKPNLPPKIQEKVDQLRKEFELLKLNKKFVWWAEERLRAQLLEIGDPKDKEYLEIVEKIKRMQSELKRLWEDSQRVIQELSKLLWEVRVEIKKISPEEISQLKGIDNKKFLEIPEEKRLKYITKDAVDSAEVANWNVKNLEFTFTFDWQFNRELYLKTTAWQVLPKEVWEIKVWWEIYSRNNIKWEFFTPDNKRLKIHEWTKIEIWNLRTPENLEKLAWNNQNQITDYLKNNPDANKDIVSQAINRWIDPRFACLAFSDLVKDLSSEQAKVVLEDAFTEFDRYRWSFNLSNELKDWKYSDKLAMWLFAQFSKDWKQSAKDYWISEEKIKAVETNWEIYYSMDAKSIQNADSLSDGTYLKWEKLLQNEDFSAKLDKVCVSLWANREDLIKVMKAESWLDPRIVNKQSWATWLIQFMPKTAEWLWTSVWNIRAMTWVEQLDLVEKYFKQNSRWVSLDSIEKLYQVVFYPLSLSKDSWFVFGSEQSDSYARKVAAQNWVIARYSNRPDWLIDWYAFSRYVNNHVSKFA